jgi:hypothetical protein
METGNVSTGQNSTASNSRFTIIPIDFVNGATIEYILALLKQNFGT